MLYLPARLAWFRANRPGVAERIRRALSFADWAVFRLTGAAATEPTQAAEMLVHDIAAGTWSDELCTLFGVPTDLLPQIHPVGSPAGALTDEAAAELGLPSGLPIVAGGCDTQAAALAVGVTRPGQAVVVAGSTMLCQQPMTNPTVDEQRRMWTSPHLAGGFVAEAHCGESGVPIDWMSKLMNESPEWIDAAAASAEPGAGGLVFVDPAPSNVGDFPLMRTAGLTFPAPLLALGRPREDVARATLEGIAFAAKAGLEWTRELAGDAEDTAVTGGVARSRTFVRILATALGRPVRAAIETNGSALGAAIVASVGGGAHPGISQAVEAMADPGEVVEPEPSWAGSTMTAYAGWRERVQRMDENTMRISHMIGPP
jgi:sugar (pentulose or hexulose) kinase